MDDIFGGYLANLGKSSSPSGDLFHDYLQGMPRRPVSVNPEKQTVAAPIGEPAAQESMATPAPCYDLAIVGGQLVLPEFGIVEGELYVHGGKIAALTAAGSGLPAHQVINARSRYVLPGIIDPHVHLGIFTPLHQELETETAAALIGGVTTVGWYVSAAESRIGGFEEIADQIQSLSHVNILPHFVINDPEQLPQIPRMIKEYGVRSFKVYMHGVPGLINSSNDAFILDVMRSLKNSGENCLLCVHAENHALVMDATEAVKRRTGDEANLADWEQSHPELAEEEAIQRMAFYAKKMQQRVYIVHVSSKAGAEMLRRVKVDNPYIFGETTSPYLTTAMADCNDFRGKMEPPLRTHTHMDALWQALEDGTISTIGTDNVTVPDSIKVGDGCGMFSAMSGYAVLETHLPSLLTEGVLHRNMPIQKLVGMMTMAPAKMFGLYPQKGSLMPGSDADITLVELDKFREIKTQNLHSLSNYSIFEGRKLAGFASMTIQGGHICAADGEIVTKPHGKIPFCTL